jgi:hypothetical protein
MNDYMEDLCSICQYADECTLPKVFPVMECAEFDDGYDGPEYYDADAVREWRDRVLYGLAPVE